MEGEIEMTVVVINEHPCLSLPLHLFFLLGTPHRDVTSCLSIM